MEQSNTKATLLPLLPSEAAEPKGISKEGGDVDGEI